MSHRTAGPLVLILQLVVGCSSNITAGGGGGGAGGGGAADAGANSYQQTGTCSAGGTTQTCCDTGTQTCSPDPDTGAAAWTNCVGPAGDVLMCQACTSDDVSSCNGNPQPPMPALCTDPTVNNEPEILVGYAPASGETVAKTGQIKVWVNDEHAPFIAPGEQLDPATGAILTPGDRTATAADGYLWEPALYIAPDTAEGGGTPHFPSAFKGDYNNTTVKGPGANIPGMDAMPAGAVISESFTGEDVWDVSALGLAPGTYTAEFVIHDGDRDRAVGCVAIVIQ